MASIGGNDPTPQIQGGTDGTLIGNTGDRLRVDAAVAPAPVSNVVYRIKHLANAGSESMAVNGSVTPVNFDFAPADGETWYIEEISALLIDSGTTAATSFGAIAALTNGCELVVRSGGVDYTIFDDLKDNTDMVHYFTGGPYTAPNSGFIEQSDSFKGFIPFNIPMLISGTGDRIRVIIRDNLTSIDSLQMAVRLWRNI